MVISGTVIRDNSTDGGGGGVFVEQDSNLSLINSTITANVAKGGGEPSGLAAGSGVRVAIQDTVFTGNTGDSVLWIDDGVAFSITGGQVTGNTVSGGTSIMLRGSGTISGTAVLSNTSTGLTIADDGVVSARSLTLRSNTGGIENSGILTITNSIIENNSGGDRAAISSENFAETNRLVMDDCTIRGNNTPGVVGITTGYAEIRNTEIVDNEVTTVNGACVIGIGEAGTTPTVEMVNVLLADNDTQGGPVVSGWTGSTTLMNVTVAGNNINGSNILFTHSAMTVTNAILWGSTTSAEDMLGGPGTFWVGYSDIEGGWSGTGNISTDPLFVDPANGDYHLQADSPCIDAGTPVGAPATDLEGTPRDAAPDMGAYEWGRFRIFLPVTLKSFAGKQ